MTGEVRNNGTNDGQPKPDRFGEFALDALHRARRTGGPRSQRIENMVRLYGGLYGRMVAVNHSLPTLGNRLSEAGVGFDQQVYTAEEVQLQGWVVARRRSPRITADFGTNAQATPDEEGLFLTPEGQVFEYSLARGPGTTGFAGTYGPTGYDQRTATAFDLDLPPSFISGGHNLKLWVEQLEQGVATLSAPLQQ
ncbi:MAG TPA: hypothetical protein VGS08_01915 [Candidatus Saccharimonadales bacterium]|nr:hypothetical protein [Candidatus Saccharimonadales bacterium]